MSNIEKVKAFIVENFLFGDDTSLKNDTSFLEEHIIDSTGMLEVITFLEESSIPWVATSSALAIRRVIAFSGLVASPSNCRIGRVAAPQALLATWPAPRAAKRPICPAP